MEIRNGPGEEQTARIVPVVFALDDLGAGGGNEFADVDLQLFADKVFEIAFFEVLIEAQLGGRSRVDSVLGLPEAERDVEADVAGRGIRRLIRHQLDHV